MSTLFTQAPREFNRIAFDDLDDFLVDALKLAEKYDVTVADVIATKHALELKRKNDLYVANGDAFDEQLAGFGEILKEIHDALHSIAEGLEQDHA